jgi:GH15 family glucan-1,4-alpha-glucosidase
MRFVFALMCATTMDEPQISDYALIGDSRGAALVSRYGSIDWCCLPEFDSPAIFAALLDRSRGGYFSIHPIPSYESAQNYLPNTNVSETIFITDSGRVSLTEAFDVKDEGEKQRALYPDHEILRVVEGIAGTVRMKMQYVPRIFYGRSPARLVDRKKLGIIFSWKEGVFTLLTTLPPEQLTLTGAEKVEAEFEVKRGERIYFSLSYCDHAPAIIPELKRSAWSRLQATINYWRDWIGKCKYQGLYAEHVRRSALVLKLLTHAPSGSIIAAPTTSLPEQIGSERNWDYRYCWLRDASFTVRVLLRLGFEDEVKAYMNWILHATRLTRPRLQVVYSTYGHARLREQTLDWLSGYRDSPPVRIGNSADGQFQLDVYGEVLDAIYLCSELVHHFDNESRKFIIGLGKVICRIWDVPDNGIWEVRSGEVHHTHSKVMCWVGLDRVIKICKKYRWEDAPLAIFEETRTRIHSRVEESG